MKKLLLFIDGSVNPKTKVGYGAYLTVSEKEIHLDGLKERVKVQRFEDTSSTKLELQTLLWALSENHAAGKKILIYTDSQNIISLPSRRERLEQNNYYSKDNKKIKNYREYIEFYKCIDQFEYKLIKLIGHKLTKEKDAFDCIFTIVDRVTRKALRNSY